LRRADLKDRMDLLDDLVDGVKLASDLDALLRRALGTERD